MNKVKIDSLEDIVDELLHLRQQMEELGWVYDQSMFKLALRFDDAPCGCYAGFIVEKCASVLDDEDFTELTHGTGLNRWRSNAAANVNVMETINTVYDVDSEWGNVMYNIFSSSRGSTVVRELMLYVEPDEDRIIQKIMILEVMK